MGAGWIRRRRVSRLVRELDRSAAACGWRVPEDEAAELRALKPCQARALLHIRKRCLDMHEQAMPFLMARTEQLGFTAQDLARTLAYIREQAPLIIHVNLARDGAALAADTHYRNLFEFSAGAEDTDIHARSRKDWEGELFGKAYRGVEAFDRCKYGVLNVTNDPQGVRCCAPVYGSSYLLLRGVRLRTTLSAEDSAGLEASELATVDRYAHVLARYTDSELQATLEVGTRRSLGANSLTVAAYKEAQIHGEVRLSDHVALVMAHPSLRESSGGVLERLSDRCGAPLVWMEGADEQDGDEDEELRLSLERSREEADLERALAASRGAADGEASPGDDEELRLALEASRQEAAGLSPEVLAPPSRTPSGNLAARDRGLAEAIEASRLARQAGRQAGTTPPPRSEISRDIEMSRI